MPTVAFAGFLIGVIISLPVGPLAALSALYWMEARQREAALVAIGAICGDATLAVLMLIMFKMPLPDIVPYWLVLLVGLTVMTAMAVMVWQRAERKTLPAAKYGGLGGAMTMAMTHPGNTLAISTLYAALLPAVSGKGIGGLGQVEIGLLLAGLLAGKVFAWAAFLKFVDWCLRRYGEIPPLMRRRLGQAVSAFMLLAAGGLALDLLQVLFKT